MKGSAILVIESDGIVFRKLVRTGTTLRFVPVEEMYDVIKREHELCNHGGRNIMPKRLKKKKICQYHSISQLEIWLEKVKGQKGFGGQTSSVPQGQAQVDFSN